MGNLFELYRHTSSSEEHRQGPVTIASTSGTHPPTHPPSPFLPSSIAHHPPTHPPTHPHSQMPRIPSRCLAGLPASSFLLRLPPKTPQGRNQHLRPCRKHSHHLHHHAQSRRRQRPQSVGWLARRMASPRYVYTVLWEWVGGWVGGGLGGMKDLNQLGGSLDEWLPPGMYAMRCAFSRLIHPTHPPSSLPFTQNTTCTALVSKKLFASTSYEQPCTLIWVGLMPTRCLPPR